MTHERIAEAARRMAETFTPGDLDATLSQITAAAVEVLPDVQYASITVLHADGRLETVAPTDEMLLELDAAQYEYREGPCYEAATETVHVTAPDLENDPRFPRYAPVALRHGIRGQAGIRLFDSADSRGALNLYSESAGAFADLGLLGRLFAHQSAIALDYAREIDRLQEAMEGRGIIGQAVGIIMERYGLDTARAFGYLVRRSQQENRKVRVLAEELVASSDADAPDADRAPLN